MIHASTIIQTAPIRRENARLVKIELVGGKEVCNHWLLTKHSLHFIHIPVVDPVVVADFERESVRVELTALDLAVRLRRFLGNIGIVGFKLQAIVVNVKKGAVDVPTQAADVAIVYVVVVVVVVVRAVDELLLGELIDPFSDIVFDCEGSLNCPCLKKIRTSKLCSKNMGSH